MRREDAQPILAGVAAALVGFAGSFAVVLAGLRAIGANHSQASSGLLVLSVTMGITGIVLCWRTRMPVSIAWSTPGAALLIGAGAAHGGYAAALGAFVVSGLLVVAAGLSRRFEHAIAAIPAPLASALLAGVLLPICVSPARAAVALPGLTAPVIVTWLVLLRIARRLAVLGALVAAGVSLAVDGRLGGGAFTNIAPSLTATRPHFELSTMVSLGLPLFLVTMASQNLAGVSVLALHGCRPHLRPILTSTGFISSAVAPLGGHGINLAAITAALMAGPDADPRPERRWIAGAAGSATYLVLGPAAGLATAFIASSPPLLIEAVAGLALLSALSAALAAATVEPGHRDAALVTFATTASGITALGLNAPFWGLLAGLVVLAVQRVAPVPA
ncbi:MAG: benzoate/H(+) symporter BenE family transporter [Solirubrobacteraceae bacterium]